MKLVLIFTLICLIFGDAFTAPVSEESQAVIIYNDNYIKENGDYKFSFKTSNGIRRSEYGNVINTGSQEYVRVRGEYSYVDPDGELVTVSYYADDTGFHILPSMLLFPPTRPPPPSPISGGLDSNVVASLLGG